MVFLGRHPAFDDSKRGDGLSGLFIFSGGLILK